MTIARLGLKVKVIGQSRVRSCGQAWRGRGQRQRRSRARVGVVARLGSHSTTPTSTPSPTFSRGSSRYCRRVVQLATGMTSIARVGRKDVGVSGESESVSASASCNASCNACSQRDLDRRLRTFFSSCLCN